MIPLLLALVPATSPQEAVAAATKDVVKRPDAAHVRYLSMYHVQDRTNLESWEKVLNFWLNSLSREGDLYRVSRVSPGLWRVDLRDFGFRKATWDKFADPYFSAKVKRGNVELKVSAPWTNQLRLILYTKSEAPIVRADWFLVETAQQLNRNGTGYYDFLRIANRKQFQDLVGLDQKKAEDLHKEVRAIVARSGVTLNNRQIIRFATITGAYWVTLDVNNQLKERNALRNLNGDYKHDAEEIYGSLPNGLFAFFLSDAQGNRQDAAPDNIASDHLAPGNDKRVHVGHSCVRCHSTGIQPIKDWGRKVYRDKVVLASADYDKLKRLRRLYLSDLEKYVKRDTADYGDVVLTLTGLKSEVLAKTYAGFHGGYQEADLNVEAVALETGHSKEKILATLKSQKYLDPVLASLLQEETIRREHFEEVFPLLMTYLKEYKP